LAEIRPNKSKHKLANDEVVTIVTGPIDANLIEFFGEIGFDGAWIDSEHGPHDFNDLANLTRACDIWSMTSLVRVNLNMQGVVYRTLDQGAQGIIMPHVNTAEEARAVVDSAKFYPDGHRGSFTSRQGLGVEGYFQKANNETMVVVMIEDIVAIENLPEILEVDNIDVYYVAPGDLAQSMGLHGQRKHPKVINAIHNAIEQISSVGKISGIPPEPFESTLDYIDMGVRFFVVPWTEWAKNGAKDYISMIANHSS